jgi:uncharacterized 2Fe-2S/4Fe-4S cluster protein (DUF4445 family)
VELCALCFKADNTPFILEKTLPFEVPLEFKDCKDICFTPECEVVNVSFNIVSGNTLELRTKLQTVGNTALGGAALLLAHPELSAQIAKEAAECKIIDLNMSAAFNELFITHMMFPTDEEEDW